MASDGDTAERQIQNHIFGQWGSGEIPPVDVATMWSYRPYYRSVVNTLMVGLPYISSLQSKWRVIIQIGQ